jgi:hypothetical protein
LRDLLTRIGITRRCVNVSPSTAQSRSGMRASGTKHAWRPAGFTYNEKALEKG